MDYLSDTDFLLLVLLAFAGGYVLGRLLWRVLRALWTGLVLVVLAIVTSVVLLWQAMVDTLDAWVERMRRGRHGT